MNAGFNTNPSNCCGEDCCYKFDVEGCAAGVPYIQLTLVTASTSTIKWMNLNTGDLVATKPAGFVTGSCADVPANSQTCYEFGADSYSVYTVNAVTTYFKNGTLLTAQVDIDAAIAVIATATYANIADCNPVVPQDSMTCYIKSTVVPGSTGTAQSPANNTILVPSNTQVTTVWNCTADTMGTAGGSGGFNAPYVVYNGTTPMVVNDDNGMTCSTNARLDQGDILAASFQGYNGVVYGVACGMRKLSADGLGAATVRIDIKKPDGSIVTGVASGSSTRQGGGAGWTNFGYYVNGQGSFTADQTGTYTMLITGTSAAPARLNFPEAKVISAAGEVLSVIPASTTETEWSAITQNGVTKYYDAAGNEVTGAALTTLLADIASGAAAVGCCTQCLPEVVPADNSTCYAKTVDVPGSDVFTVQSAFPAKVAQDGSGTLLETVFTQTYVSGAEADGQYSLRNGTNDHGGSTSSYAMAFNFGIGSPAVPYKFYSQKLIGTPGKVYSAGYWAKDRPTPASASFRMDVKDGATTLATGTSGTMTTTYTNYRTSTFTMPAAGFVMVEMYNLVNGNASSNDPLLDDIGLWETTAATSTTTTYTKTTQNGVDTYTDANGNPVTGAALTALLAAIAAGEYAVVPCSAGCGCTADDLISTDAGNTLIEGTDGKLYMASTVLWDDDQVLTGDNTGNTTVTLTPTVITDPDNPGVSQTNYTVKVQVKTDGSTLVTDPVTGVISAANQKFDVLTTAQPTPTATGNTTNLNTIFTDSAGNKWAVDSNGDAILLSAAVFKEQNRFYADPNGLDTNTGANEAPKLTAQAAVTALGQGDTAVLNEGTYAAVTMSVQNTALAGASGAYGSLSQIAGVTVATASGTSNKISDLTITGNLARTGNAPLYVNNTTVSGNVTLAGTAYTEIRDSSIQDGSITVSGASTLYIEDSKIGTSTFSTAGSVIAMRNVTIDAGDCVNIGAGVVYSLQDVNGCVNIDPAAVNAEQAAIAGGLTATQAEDAVTSNFMHIRMHNADLEANPTQVVTRDPVTGELEVSNISDIIPDACCVPTGGTDGQVLTVQPDGSTAWETPAAGASTKHEFLKVTATAGQTTQTLPSTPVLGTTGKVKVIRNGVDISDSWTWVGGVGTYNPANNYGCVIDANDKLTFDWEAAV